MFVEEPFAGYDGSGCPMPPRNVVPKPMQKPHPPLWVACSRRETILLAAQKGIGALSFSFVEPEQAKEWVDEYHAILASEECVPGGFAVNPQRRRRAAVHAAPRRGRRRSSAASTARTSSASRSRTTTCSAQHRPGGTNVWKEFEANRADVGSPARSSPPTTAPLGVKLLQEGLGSLRGAIGTPEQVTDLIERYERAGVDQVIFVSQAGRNRHEHICESLELFGREVLPQFAEGARGTRGGQAGRLAEACERALARREPARLPTPPI